MTFKKFISLCKRKCNGDILSDDFFSIIEKECKIKKYIPLIEKSIIIENCSFDIFNIDIKAAGTSIFVSEVETIKMFEGFMNYINIDVPDDEKTYDNYDIIRQSGIQNYVSKVQNGDQNLLMNMIDKAHNINIVEYVKDVIKSFNSSETLSSAIIVRDMLKDKETTNAISNILDFDDPVFKTMRDKLK